MEVNIIKFFVYSSIIKVLFSLLLFMSGDVELNPGPGTPKDILQEYSAKLSKAISADVKNIANALFSKKLVTKGTKDYVVTTVDVTTADKADRIINDVADQLEAALDQTRYLVKVCDILTQFGGARKEMGNAMLKKLATTVHPPAPDGPTRPSIARKGPADESILAGIDLHYYREALKTSVTCHLTKAVVQGEARVGKTAFKSLLLDEKYVKAGTGIAEPRVGIYCYRRDTGKRYRLTDVIELEVIVKNALKKDALEKKLTSGNETPEEADDGFVDEDEATNGPGPGDGDKAPGDESKTLLSKEVEEVLDEVQQCSGEENHLEGSQWLYLIDTGGQNAFQKLLPIFMPFAQVLILVVNISKELSSNSTAVMHIDGKDHSDGSSYSLPVEEVLKQIISSIASSMQHFRDSYRNHDVLHDLVPEKLQILTIGTHGDECSDVAESKHVVAKKLAEIIKGNDDCESIEADHVVRVREIDGRIASTAVEERGNNENFKNTKSSLDDIDEILTKNDKGINIPFYYYFFDIVLHVAAKEGCGVLQLSTCINLGKDLKLKKEEVLDSLKFLHYINSIIYYHDSKACKDLVFVNIGSLIGILKELVRYFDIVYSNKENYVGDEDVLKGILSKSKFKEICKFQLSFIRKQLKIGNIATKLLKLFVELSIATPIDDKYYIPALLPVRDVTDVNPFKDREPLLFYFKKAAPMGLFCSVVTCLLSSPSYKIASVESNFSNCIKLDYCTEGFATFHITLVEQVNYIEAHCEKQEGEGIVREDIKFAITFAAKKHNLRASHEIRFYCSCKHSTAGVGSGAGGGVSKGKKHTVEVETVNKEHIFRCSDNPRITCQEKKELWISWLDSPALAGIALHYYREALKTPVTCYLTKAVVQGEARVGKTTFKSLLLDEKYVEASTGIAEPRVGIYCYRRDTSTGKQYKLLNATELEKIVKNALKKDASEKFTNSLENEFSDGNEISDEDYNEAPGNRNEASSDKNEAPGEVPKENKAPGNKIEAPGEAPKGNEVPGDKNKTMLRKVVEKVLDEVQKCSGEENHLEGAQWLYLIDTGGQIAFQKLLPIFMPFAQVLILVVKLSEELSSQSTQVMNIEGENHHYDSPYSLPVEEVLKQILSSIASGMQHFRDSYKDHKVLRDLVPEKLQILTIGTHGDECKSDLKGCKDALKKKLAEIIKENDDCECIEDNDIVAIHEIDGRIAIKAIMNREIDETTEHSLKKTHNVLKNKTKKIEIPFYYYFFNIILRASAEKGCGVLQLSTCTSLGKDLKLEAKEVMESLKFLHLINSIIYYHDSKVCSDLVFVNIGSLIDILQELVKYVYNGRSKKDYYTGDSVIKGILAQSTFEKICEVQLNRIREELKVDNIATKLLTLFVELSIATLIDDRSKYFIPALLPVKDVTNIDPYDDCEPLLFYFKKATPMGLFCSVVTYLLSNFSYKIDLIESNFSNYIQLIYDTEEIASFYIVLVEQINCIEVHCQGQKASKRIARENVKNAIISAAKKHNLSDSYGNPEKRFYCPCKHSPGRGGAGPDRGVRSKGKEHTVKVKIVNKEHIFECSEQLHTCIKCEEKKELWCSWLDTDIPDTSTSNNESTSHSMKQSTIQRHISDTENSNALVEEAKADILNTSTSITSSNETPKQILGEKRDCKEATPKHIHVLTFTVAVIAICVAGLLLTQGDTSVASTCSSAREATSSQYSVTTKLSPSGTSCLLSSKTLDTANLNEILNALKSSLYEFGTWHALCLNLGLYESTLETIESDKKKSEDQLRSCLSKWLNRADQVDKYGGATVDSLVNALHKIEYKTAAEKFPEKLCKEIK